MSKKFDSTLNSTMLTGMITCALLFVGYAAPAAANGPCGPSTEFSGVYSQRCAGTPKLTVHVTVDADGRREEFRRDLPFSCDRQSPEFQSRLEQLRREVEKACRNFGGSGCGQRASEFAASISTLNDQIVAALPHKIKVNVWWNGLPWPRNHHRTQVTDFYRNGSSRLGEYVLNNTCEKRGEIGAVSLAIPHLGSHQSGGCFTSIAAAAKGRIDPQRFTIQREVALDGSLTCQGSRGSISAGITFKSSFTGERH